MNTWAIRKLLHCYVVRHGEWALALSTIFFCILDSEHTHIYSYLWLAQGPSVFHLFVIFTASSCVNFLAVSCPMRIHWCPMDPRQAHDLTATCILSVSPSVWLSSLISKWAALSLSLPLALSPCWGIEIQVIPSKVFTLTDKTLPRDFHFHCSSSHSTGSPLYCHFYFRLVIICHYVHLSSPWNFKCHW